MKQFDGHCVAEIGDYSRDGLSQITDTRWDGNGTLYVTVEDLMGGRKPYDRDDLMIRRMRNLAKKALMHPETIKSARVSNRGLTSYNSHYVTFAVSRIA